MSYKHNEFKVGQDGDLSTTLGMDWTPRRGRKRTFAQKRQQNKMLKSLALAVGFMAYPYAIGEAAIVRHDNTQVNHENNVYNINPEKVSGDFAYNRFKEFNLDSGYIANLLFGPKNATNASVLANLVQNKININGIVNGIKDGKIDGHLIFLSPEGIAVGASGVINAGQFTGIVPAKIDFDKLYNSTNAAVDITPDAINNLIAQDKAV